MRVICLLGKKCVCVCVCNNIERLVLVRDNVLGFWRWAYVQPMKTKPSSRR